MFCGILSSAVSGCLGLCLDGLLTCLHVGGHLVDQGVLLFEKWCLFVSFGAYGRKETIGVLKTWKRSFLCSTTLCIVGTSAYVHPLYISFSDFLTHFSTSK